MEKNDITHLDIAEYLEQYSKYLPPWEFKCSLFPRSNSDVSEVPCLAPLPKRGKYIRSRAKDLGFPSNKKAFLQKNKGVSRSSRE